MVKEDQIKIEKLEKEAYQKNCVTVGRHVDNTQQRRNQDQIFDRHKDLLTGVCPQPEAQIEF